MVGLSKMMKNSRRKILNPIHLNELMGVEIKPQPTEKQLRLVREISGIANNINQITRLANTVKSVSPTGGGIAAAVQRGAFTCKGESVNGIHKNISDPHPP